MIATPVPDCTGAVLAGGRSSRFGSNKALALWKGKPLVEHAVMAVSSVLSETVVVTKQTAPYRFLERSRGASTVEDRLSGRHPLSGVYTALSASRQRKVFVCACDMPLVQPDLIRALVEASNGYVAAVPVWGGAPQPLCAVYSRDCLNVVRRIAEEARGGIRDLFSIVPTRFLLEDEVRSVDPRGLSFTDVDTRSELDALGR